jgi:hypothetical protein
MMKGFTLCSHGRKGFGSIAAGHQQSAGTQHGQQLECPVFRVGEILHHLAAAANDLHGLASKAVKIQMRHPIPGHRFAIVDLKKTRLH